jgi:hypothetical protein
MLDGHSRSVESNAVGVKVALGKFMGLSVEETTVVVDIRFLFLILIDSISDGRLLVVVFGRFLVLSFV